ncbi:MAG: carboxymuconolactone decarboxylase family protein [Planctomycetota bacterium]
MDTKIKELIAIGASVTANCQPCLKYHVSKARENGASEQEIKEAIATAKMVRKGATSMMEESIPKILADADGNADAPNAACG